MRQTRNSLRAGMPWKESLPTTAAKFHKEAVNNTTDKKNRKKRTNKQTDKTDKVNYFENIQWKGPRDVAIINEIKTKMKNFKYQPTINEKRELEKKVIKNRYPVRPQHKVEKTAGTRILTKTERADFEKFAKLKQGKFNILEDKKIRNNWSIFCEDNDWNPGNPKPFLFMKHKNKEFVILNLENRKNFVRCLAHGLPQRSLFNIFHRFKILFDPHKVKRYTKKEDDTILHFLKIHQLNKTIPKNDRRFADLAAILDRTRSSVWRRYHNILKKRNKTKSLLSAD